ncbi:MAG: hypothetical protein AAF620_01075 [Bacteroidota bacterium]
MPRTKNKTTQKPVKEEQVYCRIKGDALSILKDLKVHIEEKTNSKLVISACRKFLSQLEEIQDLNNTLVARNEKIDTLEKSLEEKDDLIYRFIMTHSKIDDLKEKRADLFNQMKGSIDVEHYDQVYRWRNDF